MKEAVVSSLEIWKLYFLQVKAILQGSDID